MQAVQHTGPGTLNSFQYVWLGQFTTISYETNVKSRGKTTSIHWRFMHDDIPPHFFLHYNFVENRRLNVNLKQTPVCSAINLPFVKMQSILN
jgi:hypothetical protein